MQLIPVLDLLAGDVVRGLRGDRAHYRPIVSALCGTHEPLAVARTLGAHCASPLLYVADLDAIQHGRPQLELLRALLRDDPGRTLWVDAGFGGADDAQALRERLGPDGARVVPVFGSESLRSRDELARCFAPGGPGGVLSLDRRGDERLDPAGCWDAPEAWPAQVIVMTLERVGAATGPDLDTLAAVQARAPGSRVIGAGGIRDGADLARAAAAGAAGWLVASALHDGRLPAVHRGADGHRG